MSCFYFNIYNDEVTLDEEGAELEDAAAAYQYAIKAARALAAHSALEGRLTASHYVEVVDEDRKRVATIRFDEAVEIRP